MTNAALIEFLNAFQTRSSSQKARVLLMGDVALDRFVVGHADRLSPEAPVPVLLVDREFEQLGCAANVARNVAELFSHFSGLELFFVGTLGADAAAARVKDALRSLSKDRITLSLFEDASRPTAQKTRFIAGNSRSQHQLLRVDVEKDAPVSETLKNKCLEAISQNIRSGDVLIVQDYAKGLFDEASLQKLLSLAKSKGVRTIVDPNRRSNAKSYSGAWMVTPNIEEAEAMLGRSLGRGERDADMVEAARDIQKKLSIESVMITRSRFGMTLLGADGGPLHVPSMARAVSDVTGAGDTVVAVLAVALALGLQADVAARLANAAAAVVVAKPGTATASWTEVIEELELQAGNAAR